MTITREDIADLQEGDVVELGFSSGAIVRGPLVEDRHAGGLDIADAGWSVRQQDGGVPYGLERIAETLTVVSRAPRPLYVNHPRTEPVVGDVVSRGDGDGATWSWSPLRTGACRWRNTANDEWYAAEDFLDFGNGLRLLVDGSTGQVVP